jgi:hypothetical protein
MQGRHVDAVRDVDEGWIRPSVGYERCREYSFSWEVLVIHFR